ncbi:excinuclease ABC subunit UvrB [Spiroplasma culicicola]|uniref:UvrABC system protein B n=1 Tax=Spiroplasma culicicola AES-1 TaxID=1276246 RepID=W6A6E0_9MOLU|nr:excinuclease ABC subunit UvrB [Spiroplasma culicicola]AHI52415.1 excinuclease ABC subunit B [Spiroplasma culicicola AES-1]
MKKEFREFELVTEFKPGGDQPAAIAQLIEGLKENKKHQVLLGATGTGKTFTMANVIKTINKPTLVLAHNKTLAMQLYIELKELFPNNRVEYFVSNFDFYQPEAYIPAKDLYIDKDAKRNNDLEMMRLSAMNALTIRQDTIVVASVAAIYATQDPKEYSEVFFELAVGQAISKKELLTFLVQTGYTRNDDNLEMGCFSAKGDVIKIAPSWTDEYHLRVSMFGDEIEALDIVDTLNNNVKDRLRLFTVYPAAAYVTNFDKIKTVCANIEKELEQRVAQLLEQGKMLEADRLNKRTRYDIETLLEFGICSGIENYSAHLDFRASGVAPFSLIDYFGDDFLTIIDESHMMIPQVRGMFNTDRSRKETLVEHGFRLPSALDNRPLNFEEFANKLKQVIYTSATPGDYELQLTEHKVVEQIIRPTGLVDPIIEIKSTVNQMEEIISMIHQVSEKKQKVFITALTIKQSEAITDFLIQRNIKVAYLHSELKTLERNQILFDLRKGVYDVIVGVNLLREGIDVPEVSLVCILEADRQGFLRNTRSLIQTVGRAARNSEGKVIFFADTTSPAMAEAIEETSRRREKQIAYNKEHNITPTTIIKKLSDFGMSASVKNQLDAINKKSKKERLTEKQKLIEDIRKQMLEAAKEQNYEKAAELRDLILELSAE